MKIIIQHETFDPLHEQARFAATLVQTHQIGAVNAFTGNMRNTNEGTDVTSMFLEHYPGMTEKQIEKICREASNRWQLIDMLVIHRVGKIAPGETIVHIAVWSEHRAEAFNACRFLINELKSTVPFWKSEAARDGHSTWVEHNTTDNS